MKKEKTELSIRKAATEKWLQNNGKVTISLALFCLFSILSLIIGFLEPITLILTVPFLVVPSYFSLSGTLIVTEAQKDHEEMSFFILFRNYFSSFFRGCYRIIIGALKALLAFSISLTIITIILCVCVLQKDPAFTDLLSQIPAMTDEEYLRELVNFVTSNESIVFITRISTIGSLGIATLVFLHHFGVHSVKVYHNFLTLTPLPVSDLNYIYNVAYRKIRRPFRKDYFKTFWFVHLLIVLGLAGGSVFSWFILKNASAEQCFVVGLFCSFVLVIFILPYYLYGTRFLYQKYSPEIMKTFVEESFKSIDEIKKTTEIDPEKEKQIKEFLEKQLSDLNDKNDVEKK